MMRKLLQLLIYSSLLLILPLWCAAQSEMLPHNPHKAPLYWDVYEYNFLKEKAGVSDNYITERDWEANIDWVDEQLKHLGYNMICIDGWGSVDYNEQGYRTKHSHHWKNDYAWWSDALQKRGMTLGIYDNPLWINKEAASKGYKVKGTDIPLKSLIDYEETSAFGFTWVQVDRAGAEEYVKGYVRHYAEMGVKFLRVDFLSWYETGTDDNIGVVGRTDRPREHYETALRWMREACDESGMFLSLVMPHLKNDAEMELKYGHMVRINEDTAEGGWWRFSDNARGQQKENWSQFRNPFDGFIYWSKVGGRGNMILDGDFLRLNTFANDEERKTVVALNLMAGGPVAVSDQHNTIGSSLWIYQNAELLAMNRDGFVGKPLSSDPNEKAKSQVWKGQLSNGDWIVGLFNRENTPQTRVFNIASELGISEGYVRELWSHEDQGVKNTLAVSIPVHGCKIYRISATTDQVASPRFDQPSGAYPATFKLTLTAEEGASIHYTLDGSDPTTDAPIYSSAITISATTTVKALAVMAGRPHSFTASHTYTIGEATRPQSEMYVAGTFNDWNLSSLPMHYVGDYNWKSNPIALEATSYEFKFANSPDWSGDDWANATGLSGTLALTTGGKPNGKFTITQAGNYYFTFNDRTLAYAILPDEGSAMEAIDHHELRLNPLAARQFLLQGGGNGLLTVYNSSGIPVLRQYAISDNQHVDLTHLPAGIYLMEVTKENQRVVLKCISN